MTILPLHKRVELQNEVLKSIDETIFNFSQKNIEIIKLKKIMN